MCKEINNTKKAALRQPLLTKIKLKIFGLVRMLASYLNEGYMHRCAAIKRLRLYYPTLIKV
jgi:hypothetical protein